MSISSPQARSSRLRKSNTTKAKPSFVRTPEERAARRERRKRIDRKFEKIRLKNEAKAAVWRVDESILAIEGVASLLCCSVQAVRNIPADQLPRYDGPGRRVLFIKDDVLRFIRSNPRTNPAADEILRDIENGSLDSSPDSGTRHRIRSKCDD